MPDEKDDPQTTDDIDWSLTTFEGNRRRQHQEFLALPLWEKLAIIEQMELVARHFARRYPSRSENAPANEEWRTK